MTDVEAPTGVPACGKACVCYRRIHIARCDLQGSGTLGALLPEPGKQGLAYSANHLTFSQHISFFCLFAHG